MKMPYLYAIYWKKGVLIYRKQFEAMFYHLVEFKRKYSEPLDLYRTIPDEYRIGKKKIYQTKKNSKKPKVTM
jgi:hypothetical protein